MLLKRIIPCLDINDGRVVKGVKFLDLKDAGDPVKSGEFYDKEGADELVFLDITASSQKREIVAKLASQIAEKVFIPFTIGGGIRSIDDFKMILRSGADKVSINSEAIKNPSLINEASKMFGNQCVVVAIDAKKNGNKFDVYLDGGRIKTDKEATSWAKEVEVLGAGEILLTSMDKDGTKSGYDLELTSLVSRSVKIPVIASGGAGTFLDFEDVFQKGGADAALAASLFHFKEVKIKELKKYLFSVNIPVRI